jgi:hypothetical protein
MVLGQRDEHVEHLANAVSAAFGSVAAELRLVEVGDFIAFIHDEKFANIQDIVNSSVELFFKPGTVSFGWGADFELDWNSTPVIRLDMEFRHGSVWLVFKLTRAANGCEDRVFFAQQIFGRLRAGLGGADRSVSRRAAALRRTLMRFSKIR